MTITQSLVAAGVLVLLLTSLGIRTAVRAGRLARRVDELLLAGELMRGELHATLRELADARRPRSLAIAVRDPRTRPLPRFVRHDTTPTRIAREG